MAEIGFVDTSFWYALLDEEDPHHAMVVTEYDGFVGGLVTTSYVVAETVSLMCGRGHRSIAGAFLRSFAESPRCTVIHPSADVFDHAVSTFHKREDHPGLNLIDAISFVCMGASGSRIALAKDKHFAMEGFTLLPPLVGARGA